MLKWEQLNPTEWRAPDAILGGARIRALTNGFIGKPGTATFYVYRDGEYLGSDGDLEAAKARAEKRVKSPRRLEDETPEGVPAFLALSKEERAAARATVPLPQIEIKLKPEIDMSKYENMDLDQLTRAYNEGVEAAEDMGLTRFKKMSKFPSRETALKYIEQVDSSCAAKRAGDKAAAKQKGGPKPKVKEAPAPVPTKTKAKAPPTVATGKLGEFLKGVDTRPGTNKEKLAILLFNKQGEDIPVTSVSKEIYGQDNPAITAVILGLDKTLKANKLPFTIKRKEKTVGLYPAG